MNMSLHEDLSWRGLIFQESDSEGLKALLASGSQSVYCGADPTAESLHVGHLVPLLILRRFQLHGHRPIVIVGGGTGLIGDPSGKSSERVLNSKEVIDGWVEKFREQLSRVLDFSGSTAPAILVNNYDWIGQMSAIGFLRDIGKHFTVNYMLAKDSVNSRIDRDGGGISYTEFSYMILQSLDFLQLADRHDCLIQVGGSDQWGNMTAGMELIRRRLGKQAYVLTTSLIAGADGKKFGKSEGNAVWLAPHLTSPYAFYQFWLNSDDRDVIGYLKFFTFLSHEQIEELEHDLQTRPELRSAQRSLAANMTRLIHGDAELAKVMAASEALFGGGDLEATDPATLDAALASAPKISFATLDAVPTLPVLLVDAGLCPSRSEARKAIAAGGAYVNNLRIGDPEFRLTASRLLHGSIAVLRRGKKNYAIIKVLSS